MCLTDITERLRAEAELQTLMRQLEARVASAVQEREFALLQLYEAQKIETLGQITGGVAHDFNNLLTPILGGLELLKKGVTDPRAAKLINGALESSERARTLVQRLLAFARRQPLEPEPVDLGALALGMDALLQSSVGALIRVEYEISDDLPAAVVDPNQIELALLNLAVNARDAMPDGGVVRVIVNQALDPATLAPGRYIRLTVADTGVGMDEPTRQRATEPFFSTKGVGHGTGLGLSMAHGLAAQLGGALEIESAPGAGARVSLILPVASATVPLTRKHRPNTPEVLSGSVLLVDDEPLVRNLTAQMLEELGLSVLVARDGHHALELFATGSEFDWLVTDHVMPGMSGADLARAARARQPECRILIISGYADLDKIAHDFARLAKPFRQTELAQALSAA